MHSRFILILLKKKSACGANTTSFILSTCIKTYSINKRYFV